MHENFYDHPALYDLEYFNSVVEDVPHYVRLAEDAGRVLELGCGTGRLTLPMARAGVAVTGVEHDTVVAFLSSRCVTCQTLWDAFAKPRKLKLPADTQVVMLSKLP